MSLLDTIKSGDRITFSMVKSGIAGDTFTNVLVDTVASYGTATRVTTDINNKHANLYPFFKDKVNNINDASKYSYIVIKPNDLTEELLAIGIPWINEDSVKMSETKTVRLELFLFEEYKRASLETFLKNANIKYAFSDQ